MERGARIEGYPAFWSHYLRQHRAPVNRALHYLGTTVGSALLVYAIVSGSLVLAAAAVVVGYGIAWTGHFAFERNRPATFGHPVWSFLSDYRMLGLFAAGRLGSHLERAERESVRADAPMR